MCETNAYMAYTDNTIWRDLTRTWTSEASYRLSEALTRYGQAKMKQASRRRLCGRQPRINADISGGRETTLRQFNPPTWASDAGSSGNPCGMAPPCPRGHALSLASEGQAPDPKSFLGVKQYCCGSRAHHIASPSAAINPSKKHQGLAALLVSIARLQATNKVDVHHPLDLRVP